MLGLFCFFWYIGVVDIGNGWSAYTVRGSGGVMMGGGGDDIASLVGVLVGHFGHSINVLFDGRKENIGESSSGWVRICLIYLVINIWCGGSRCIL